MTGWPSEGTWERHMSPEAEAAQIVRLARARAADAVHHAIDCRCETCRVDRVTFLRRVYRAKVAARARRQS